MHIRFVIAIMQGKGNLKQKSKIIWMSLEMIISLSQISQILLQLDWNVKFMARQTLLVAFSPSCWTPAPAPATAFLCDLCCWAESVESFGCLAYLMVWWWQKPSARIKVDISLRERVARERELQYKLTMAAPVFFIFIAPSRCQPQQSLCPLWHPMAAPLHHMKEKRGGGGQLPPGIRYLNPILRSSELQWR